MNGLAARIHDALPQTQCTRCGYPDCEGYAQAVASAEAEINQCPPGGAEGVERLARLTGRPVQPLDPAFGTEGPRRLAVIDEAWCIGCTLCLDACPTDAILGINKRMHTVIDAHCTGCELCIPVCPVDCISLEDATPGRSGWQAWSPAQAAHARARYALHGQHRPTDARQGKKRPEAEVAAPSAEARKRSVVEAALARARAAAQRPSTPKP
ncbi:RnfABCDGE type electron transport complex subunit B [Variovorax sp.]|uniref:RnfABCDGE type electron transport complex subunit B n=1 Tax=Variovorax sp. TaxID=1871043 RepID=UPI000C3E4273|nr:RnfABCDGE type electron transport complex subunit B [Variovorax sp.]MBS82480.1 ferredoxin [Variovorax sp.]